MFRLILLFSFILALVPHLGWPKVTTLDRIEATINAEIVLSSDLAHFKRSQGLRAQLDPMFQKRNMTDREIVDFIISERIILSEFPATDSEVEQEINAIQANNRIDRRALQAAIEAQGFNFKDYFELIRVSISKRNLIDRDIRTKVHITEDDLRNDYYSNKRSTGAALSYRIKIITVQPQNYKTPALAKDTIQKALDRIKNGESFDEVVKSTSDDPSAQQGGDLGYLPLDELSPALRGPVKDLRIGQVSPVLGSEKTQFFVIKLADIKSGHDSEFNKAKDNIRARLTAEEFQRQIELWLEKKRISSFVHYAGQTLTTSKNTKP